MKRASDADEAGKAEEQRSKRATTVASTTASKTIQSWREVKCVVLTSQHAAFD